MSKSFTKIESESQPLNIESISSKKQDLQIQSYQLRNNQQKLKINRQKIQNNTNYSKKIYILIIFILVFYLITEYIVKLQLNYHNTRKYIQNIKTLRDYNNKYILSNSNTKSNLKQINLKNNLPNNVLIQQKNQNEIIQNPKFSGQITNNMDENIFEEANKQSIDNNINKQFEYFNNQIPSITNGMFKVPQTSFIYAQLNQIATPNPISNTNSINSNINQIQPIILPFNNELETPSNQGPFGVFASITNQQLSQAKNFKLLIQNDISTDNQQSIKQRQYYQKRYYINKYQELPFCIVVPTYNNAANDRYLRNIKSIVMQQYKNYHIVIIDDHSEDNTGDRIERYLQEQQKIGVNQYKLIKNNQQFLAMHNIRMAAINHCKPEQIFMIVDGDDELVGKQVFKLFNAVFQQKKLWFVYSNFLSMHGEVGFSRPFPATTIRNNLYRSYPFVTSHLRAFYTKLFLNIKEQDLKDNKGQYLRAANDVAICIPILQQAHERVGYLPQITYFYNSDTGFNNHQIRITQQRGNDRLTRRRSNYESLEKLFD